MKPILERTMVVWYALCILVACVGLGATQSCDDNHSHSAVPPALTTCHDWDGDGPAIQVPSDPFPPGLRICKATVTVTLAHGRITRTHLECFYNCPEDCIQSESQQPCAAPTPTPTPGL